jgi:hypothetical protein
MQMQLTLAEIKTKVDALAEKIGASGYALPAYGYSEDFARPHIEIDSRGYHYVVIERGQEQSRLTTHDLDELLYIIFSDVTFGLACDYELAHRIETQDVRRIIFRHQLELLMRLKPEWGQREIERHKEILSRHPFDDMANIRATLTKKLRDKGHSADAAWQMACEKYPLPDT